MTSNTPTLDERLCAYLDNELSEAERSEIEDLLVDDEAIADRLEALALANSDFVEFAEEIDDIPMSAGLSELVERLKDVAAQPEPQAAPSPAVPHTNVIAFPLWKRAMRQIGEHRAIAASVMIGVIAAGISPVLLSDRADPPPYSGSVILASSDLGAFLTVEASGTTFERKDQRLTPALSFATDTGTPCRVVNYWAPDTDGQFVACRTDGNWHVEQAAYRAIKGEGPDADYQSASGGAIAEIEAYLDQYLFEGPFSVTEEQDLLNSDWAYQPEEK